MFRSITNNVAKNLSAGGTITGDLTISGDLTVSGSSAITTNEVIQGTSIIDGNSTEAFLVRKDGDGGDVFIVDTTNSEVEIGGSRITGEGANKRLKLHGSGDNYVMLGSYDDNGWGYLNSYNNASGLQFYTGAGAFYFNNGSVGIGTDAPDQLLEISHSDTTAITGANIAANNCQGLHIDHTADTDTAGSVIKLSSNTDGCQSAIAHIQVDDNDADLAFYTDNAGTLTEAMRIDNVGNIGVGLADPTNGKKMTLKEHASHSAAIQFMDTDGSPMGNVGLNRTAGALLAGSSSEALVFTSTYGGSPLQLGTADVVRLTISTAGNIGIGTVTPLNVVQINHSGADGDNGLMIINEATTIASGALLGGVGFDSADGNVPSSVLEASSAIIGYASQAHSATEKGGFLTFNTTDYNADDDTANVERMRIDSNFRLWLSNEPSANTGNTIIGNQAWNHFGASTDDDGSDYNTIIGHQAAGQGTLDGASSNTAIGYRALTDLTSGDNNVAVGKDAASSLTDSSYNTVVGYESLITEIQGTHTTAIGYQAGYAQNKGSATAMNNSYVGLQAGYNNVTGINNTAIGQGAGKGVSTKSHSNCVYIGKDAGLTAYTGAGNIAIGASAMDDTDAGTTSGASENNIFVGFHAGGGQWANTQTDNAVGIGAYALYGALSNVDGTVAIGGNALTALTSGAGNVAVGYNSGAALTTGEYNTILGYGALDAASTEADDNVAIGVNAMGGAIGTEPVKHCVAIGSGVMAGALTGASGTDEASGTVGIGRSALAALTSGARNVAIGYQSALTLTAGEGNVSIGYQSLTNCTTNTDNNVAIGTYALSGAIIAEAVIDCVAIGTEAMDGALDATASGSVAVGRSALGALTSGASNTAVGYLAATALTTGGSNTVLGWSALSSANGAEGNNVAIGKSAGDVIDGGSDNIIIGTSADPSTAAAANQIVIGHATTGQADNSVTLGNADVTDVYMAQDGAAEVHCGTLAVGLGTGSTAGSGCLAEIGDPETGAGGMLFKVFSMNEDTATTFFTIAGSNLWAGIIEVTWNATDDTNRSGYQLSRFSYDDTFTSLIASSQNSTITLSLSTNDMQVSLTGAGSSVYRMKIRIMGGRRA